MAVLPGSPSGLPYEIATRLDSSAGLKRSCGVSYHNGVGRHIASDDGARTDHRAFADHEAWENRRVCSDRGSPLHGRHGELGWPDTATRKGIVRECCIWANEDVVFQTHAIPQLDPALHCHSVSDDYVILNEDPVTYVAVLANDGARQNVRECPDAASRSDVSGLAQRLWVDIDLVLALGHVDVIKAMPL